MGVTDTLRVRVLGHDTCVHIAGAETAPPLLLLHDGAWGGSAMVSWEGVIRHLAEHYRVIAPDMLGFGETAKVVQLDSSPYEFRIHHIIALLDELGYTEPVHVVGTSFGGSVGLHMLALTPDRVASLMSISGTGGPWRTAFGIQILGSWDGTRDTLQSIVDTLAEESEELSVTEHLEDRFASASIPGHYRSMMAPGVALPDPLKRVNEAAASWPSPLTGVETPVLLVQGIRDSLLDANWTEHLQQILPRSEALQLDALHSPNLTAPTSMAGTIHDWITRQEVTA